MSKKTIWVSRWALTKGIERHNAELFHNGEMARYKVNGFSVYVHGKDFHLTEKAAKERAEEVRLNKIKSAEKNLAKLKALAF